MKANVGSIDRAIRLILGLITLGLGWYFQSWFGLLGVVFIATGLMNYCPLYAIFGIKTCSISVEK